MLWHCIVEFANFNYIYHYYIHSTCKLHTLLYVLYTYYSCIYLYIYTYIHRYIIYTTVNSIFLETTLPLNDNKTNYYVYITIRQTDRPIINAINAFVRIKKKHLWVSKNALNAIDKPLMCIMNAWCVTCVGIVHHHLLQSCPHTHSHTSSSPVYSISE